MCSWVPWRKRPRASQWTIYYHRMWVKLSTTCSNLLKKPNGELLVVVNHNQLRTTTSETVDPIDWSHPPLYTGQYPLSSTYCTLQCGLGCKSQDLPHWVCRERATFGMPDQRTACGRQWSWWQTMILVQRHFTNMCSWVPWTWQTMILVHATHHSPVQLSLLKVADNDPGAGTLHSPAQKQRSNCKKIHGMITLMMSVKYCTNLKNHIICSALLLPTISAYMFWQYFGKQNSNLSRFH